jgi:hypothetical protein
VAQLLMCGKKKGRAVVEMRKLIRSSPCKPLGFPSWAIVCTSKIEIASGIKVADGKVSDTSRTKTNEGQSVEARMLSRYAGQDAAYFRSQLNCSGSPKLTGVSS